MQMVMPKVNPPMVILSAETLPETVSTLDPNEFTVRFEPINTFAPSSVMLSNREPPNPPES
jgi:hypothetical protein